MSGSTGECVFGVCVLVKVAFIVNQASLYVDSILYTIFKKLDYFLRWVFSRSVLV